MTTPRQELAKYTTTAEMSSFFIDKCGLISVKAYGATGDGVTDDTAAVQRAVDTAAAAGSTGIFWPFGSYNVGVLTNYTSLTFYSFDIVTFTGTSYDVYYYSTHLSDKTHYINVMNAPYNCKGDDTADDTQGILDAIAGASAGDRILVPLGTFKTTAEVSIDKNVDFIMLGIIKAYHEGTAIKVDSLGTGGSYIPELRLKATKFVVDHTQASVGVDIHNTYGCKIRVDFVAGFTRNFVMSADIGHGCVYNEVSLGQVYNSKTQIHLTAPAGGWVNQNTIISGRLYHPASGSRTGYEQIKIDGDTGDTPLYRCNGNIFVGTALEDVGSGGVYAKAVTCNGLYNHFIGLRTEGSMAWTFGTMTFRNKVSGGTYVYLGNITDNGTFNELETIGAGSKHNMQEGSATYIAGANGVTGLVATGGGATRYPLRVYNYSGGGYPALQIMAADGATVEHDIRGGSLGFFRAAPIAKPAITGSRAGNAALASLLTQLATYGLITDNTTA